MYRVSVPGQRFNYWCAFTVQLDREPLRRGGLVLGAQGPAAAMPTIGLRAGILLDAKDTRIHATVDGLT
jgi:hypothetical protein